MTDKTVVEPFAVAEYFVDGFTDHKIVNGVFSCAGYRLQSPSRPNGSPLKVVVLRIVLPANCVPEAISQAQAAITPSQITSLTGRRNMSS